MDTQTRAWLFGAVGMLIFCGSLPATRVAVLDLDPVFLTLMRAAIAAALGGAVLLVTGQAWPDRSELLPLSIVTAGVVIGFPLLSAVALQYLTAAHAAVYLGLLPLSTTLFSILRGDRAPRPAFWVFALAGAAMVTGYVLAGGISLSPVGDLAMALSILVCGMGYAEGARLTRRLGGWQTTAWALVLAAPATTIGAWLARPASLDNVAISAWLGLGYLAVFSMLVGFVFWYRGLALGGTAAVGQLQLLQPFLGVMLAGWLLGEPVDGGMIAVCAVVALCVIGVRRYGAAPVPVEPVKT